MKTKHSLLATSMVVAASCIGLSTAMAQPDSLPELPLDHPGHRSLPFTGELIITSHDDPGTPTADGYGFRDAKSHAELTISIPLLGLTD